MAYQIPDDKIGPAFAYASAHHLNLNDLIALIGHYVEQAAREIEAEAGKPDLNHTYVLGLEEAAAIVRGDTR